MSYIAVHYVKIGRRMYTPGEIIDEHIPEEKRAWLLGKGAIRIADAPFLSPEPPPILSPDPPAAEEEDGEEDAQDEDEADHDDEDEEDGEEIVGEAPEIDVMDGIVAGPEEPAQAKPKQAGRRKKA